MAPKLVLPPAGVLLPSEPAVDSSCPCGIRAVPWPPREDMKKDSVRKAATANMTMADRWRAIVAVVRCRIGRKVEKRDLPMLRIVGNECRSDKM